ncbi:MAG: hypothetical protein EXS13_14690 [Planctomycetes bacterium]|nr:hypothetical protein [Planctomycetota bacterium]
MQRASIRAAIVGAFAVAAVLVAPAQASAWQGTKPAATAPTAEQKALSAKVVALERAFKAIKDDAPLKPRQEALTATLGQDDAKIAKALLGAVEQLLREFDAVVVELGEVKDKHDELTAKLREARGKQPKPDEKSRLEKWAAEIKRLSERRNALSGLNETIAARVESLQAPDALVALLGTVSATHRFGVTTRTRIALHAAGAQPPLIDALVGSLTASMSTEERVIALEALAACGRAAGVHAKLLGDCLLSSEPALSEAALWALAACGSPEAIAPLCHRVGEEVSPFAARRVGFALRYLTGVDLGWDVRAWRAWQGSDGAKRLDGSVAMPERRRATCFDLPLYASSVAFVIDCSAAMLAKRPKPGGGEETRLDAAKREVLGAIERLPADARYTVVAYAHEPRSLSKALLPATPENLGLATEWMGKVTTVEKTVAATSEALSRVLVDVAAFEVPEGRTSKLDTIVLITAGVAVAPDGKPEPPAVLKQLIELRNKPVQAVIEAVVLGDPRAFSWLVDLVQSHAGRIVAR